MTATVTVTERRRAGLAYLAAAGTWVAYLVLAFTVSNGYEEALVDASDATGTATDRLPAETLAEIVRDHPWSNLSTLVLMVAPAVLLVAVRRAGAVSGDRWAVPTGWVGAVVLWTYFLLHLGLNAGPDSLPPLTRDLDRLTVPFVSVGSVLSLAAFVLSAWALRRHGWRPIACTVAVVIVAADALVSVVLLVTSDFGEPVPPIALLPAELIVGVALVTGRRGHATTGDVEVDVPDAVTNGRAAS